MTKVELNNEYFEWMCQLVNSGRRSPYKKLLRHLHGIIFNYTIPMDGNRADDGIDLRYRFGFENQYPEPMIAEFLDDRPCSILEMMAALAFRCEEHIMSDPDEGDRTGLWFWSMIRSLGLDEMTDSKFNPAYVNSIIFKFMNHDYERNGSGGLFTINDRPEDMRTVEIWTQMNWYLTSTHPAKICF
jgi:hypothetical protein